jgi:hypothetical protein
MANIPDLTAVSYSGLNGPIRAVGWLESPYPFSHGSVDPDFRERLMALIERPFFGLACLGLHWCSLCAAEGKMGPDPRSSQTVLLVPASNCVYEAPIWIGHYVLGHSYQPPDEFCRAVTSCPEPGSDEFRKALLAHVPELGHEIPDGWNFFDEWNAQQTLDPDPECGSEAAFMERAQRNCEPQEPPPSREQLIEKHGGFSNEKCIWQGCDNRALANMAICVEHAYPTAAN